MIVNIIFLKSIEIGMVPIIERHIHVLGHIKVK